jgi:hypothetical protein
LFAAGVVALVDHEPGYLPEIDKVSQQFPSTGGSLPTPSLHCFRWLARALDNASRNYL